MRILKPYSLTQALEFLKHNKGALPIAGFTGIAPALHREKSETESKIASAAVGIDMSMLDELKRINIDGNGIEFGALVTYSDIIKADLPLQYKAIVQAAAATGTPQVRNRGTIGGNLATASPTADLLTSLCVFDAVVKIESLESGARNVSMKELFVSPVTCIKENELITSVFIKPLPSNVRSCFMKIGRRAGSVVSLVNMAAAAVVKDRAFAECYVCAGCVAPHPVRFYKLESFVVGKTYEDIVREEASVKSMIQDSINPESDLHADAEYRKKVTEKMFFKLLEDFISI